MKIDIQKFENLVDEGLLSCRKHPKVELYIWNYTPQCQFDKIWTEETMMARGLITDKEGEVIARPFKKFFNVGEHQGDLPSGIPEWEEKLDGSLGILYFTSLTPDYGKLSHIATRGSFESEQAKMGSAILEWHKDKYAKKNGGGCSFLEGHTYLFEIIYPQNKIVVDYGGEEKLVLLAIINNETGEELPLNDRNRCGFEIAKRYGFFVPNGSGPENIPTNNREGYVLRWPNGFRLKYKFDEYVRLHKLLTGLTARRIWEMIRDKEDIKKLLEKVPDEFYQWTTSTMKRLLKSAYDLRTMAQEAIVKNNYRNMIRKDAALHIMRNYKPISNLIFMLLDNKDPEKEIIKMIKPSNELPFKTDIDA